MRKWASLALEAKAVGSGCPCLSTGCDPAARGESGADTVQNVTAWSRVGPTIDLGFRQVQGSGDTLFPSGCDAITHLQKGTRPFTPQLPKREDSVFTIVGVNNVCVCYGGVQTAPHDAQEQSMFWFIFF